MSQKQCIRCTTTYLQENHNNSQYNIGNQQSLQCRICLQNSDDSPQPMITPCLCTGTIKYVHSQCLKQWIKKLIYKQQMVLDSQYGYVSCELCAKNICFTVTQQINCNTLSQVAQKIKKKTKQFIVLVATFLISLIFLMVLLLHMIETGWQTLDTNVFLIILMICGEVVFLLVSITAASFIIKRFFTHKQKIIDNINAGPPSQHLRKSLKTNKKVYPDPEFR